MYLIIKDPTARTVRVEHECGWLPELTTIQMNGSECAYSRRYEAWIPAVMTHEFAEKTAKSIAIKENLIYTPQIEY